MNLRNPFPARRAAQMRAFGATMLESLAYLGIASFVILGAVSMTSSVLDAQKEREMIESLQKIIDGVHRNLKRDFVGFGTQFLKDYKLQPASWTDCHDSVDASGRTGLNITCKTPMGRVWMGVISYTYGSGGTHIPNGWAMTFDEFPSKHCPAIASFLANSIDTSAVSVGASMTAPLGVMGGGSMYGHFIAPLDVVWQNAPMQTGITPKRTMANSGLYDCKWGSTDAANNNYLGKGGSLMMLVAFLI